MKSTRKKISSPAAGATLDLSVVFPLFNEEDAIGTLLAEIEESLTSLGSTYEIVAVDDKSTDASLEILEAAATRDHRLRILRNPENRGQGAALYTAIRAARGSIVITLDSDGQNDPGDIPRLLPLLEEADMVVGIRQNRQDTWLRREMSRLANRVRSRVLGDGVRDSGCALKVFRREVIDALIPIKTLYSFIPALAVAAGFRVTECEVNHRPRAGGESSYGLRAFLWKPALDLFGIWWFSRRHVGRLGDVDEFSAAE